MRPILEYCSTIWDPHDIKKYTYNLKMVQRRAARFTLGRFHNLSSPTEMLQQLQWETLVHRRRIARLVMFFKIQHGLVAVPLLRHILSPLHNLSSATKCAPLTAHFVAPCTHCRPKRTKCVAVHGTFCRP